jgi:hypothetical protein
MEKIAASRVGIYFTQLYFNIIFSIPYINLYKPAMFHETTIEVGYSKQQFLCQILEKLKHFSLLK